MRTTSWALCSTRKPLPRPGKGRRACAAVAPHAPQSNDKSEGFEAPSSVLALARKHYEEALEFYSGEGYLSVFVEICLDRARLEQQFQETPGQGVSQVSQSVSQVSQVRSVSQVSQSGQSVSQSPTHFTELVAIGDSLLASPYT